MEDTYDFGKILQNLRKKKGITQEQLAKIINKESSIISRYERNLQTPTFETVRLFAAIFNVSMDYLSGMEKSTNISTVGLTTEQSEIVYSLVKIFKDTNSSFSKNFTKEQYQLIGRIAVEFSR